MYDLLSRHDAEALCLGVTPTYMRCAYEIVRRSLTRRNCVFWEVCKRSTKLNEESDEGGADYVAATGL